MPGAIAFLIDMCTGYERGTNADAVHTQATCTYIQTYTKIILSLLCPASAITD